MSVYKRGKNWYIDYYDPSGKRVRKSVGPTTKREAEKMHAKFVVDMKEDRYLDKKQVLEWNFDTMAEDYLEYSEKHKRSAARDGVSIRALKKHFAGKRIRNITPSDIDDYKKLRLTGELSGKEVAESTVNRELACLKAMYNRLIRDGKHHDNPVRRVKFLNEDHLQRDRILSDAEYMRLQAAANPLLRSIIQLAYWTGMRQGEILGLRWEKVDLITGYLVLSPKETKTKRQRIIPFTDDILNILSWRQVVKDGPFVFHRKGEQIKSVRQAFDNARERAGIEDFVFHDLRHMAITRWVKLGLPENAIMTMSGHRTRRVFDRYVNLKPDDLKRLVNPPKQP